MKKSNLPFLSVAAVSTAFLAWLIVGELQLVSPIFLPSPVEVYLTAKDLLVDGYRNVSLLQHVAVSIGRALLAFAVAIITGIPIGLLMGMSPAVNAILDPFVQFLRPLPKLALIPLVIVWFGIGELSKFLLIYLSTLLTIIVAAAAAVMSVPEGRIRAALSLGATQVQLFRHVILMNALPELFTGVRVAIGIGWTTLIAAEMIASTSGIGWMVLNASSYLRTDVVMLGILILGTTGYLLDLSIVAAQRLFIHWIGKA
jgi:taurine transport system permease protein